MPFTATAIPSGRFSTLNLDATGLIAGVSEVVNVRFYAGAFVLLIFIFSFVFPFTRMSSR